MARPGRGVCCAGWSWLLAAGCWSLSLVPPWVSIVFILFQAGCVLCVSIAGGLYAVRASRKSTDGGPVTNLVSGMRVPGRTEDAQHGLKVKYIYSVRTEYLRT